MADSLLRELRDRIRSTGAIPFATFMELALYHAQHGYYTTRVPGHGGDYATSPTITPWFGRLVARELQRMWQALGRPDPFTVVEVGGGLGGLAAGAMEGAGPLAGVLEWRFIEQFDRVQQLQRRRLGSGAQAAAWARTLGEPPVVVGCVLANEVLDNFPFHLLQMTDQGEVKEVYVDLDGDRLVERLGSLSVEDLVEPARQAGRHLTEGARFEVCLRFEMWCRQVSQTLERGYLLVIDYGDIEPDIWTQGREGSLKTYSTDGMGQEPLKDPGGRDITADVDFSAVARAAQAAGFEPEWITTQKAWLRSLGVNAVAEELELAGFEAALQGRRERAVALQAELGRVLKLVAQGGLGDILVLRAGKATQQSLGR